MAYGLVQFTCQKRDFLLGIEMNRNSLTSNRMRIVTEPRPAPPVRVDPQFCKLLHTIGNFLGKRAALKKETCGRELALKRALSRDP